MKKKNLKLDVFNVQEKRDHYPKINFMATERDLPGGLVGPIDAGPNVNPGCVLAVGAALALPFGFAIMSTTISSQCSQSGTSSGVGGGK
ncbi:hypothetical protein KKA14_16515 [bacterium]|nr:hypothetical protein [bacterium]